MEYMDEWDPDWPGDPKISTLKKIAFNNQRNINQLTSDMATSTSVQTVHSEEILSLMRSIARISRENNISNLYFQDKITKEEAKRLWKLYQSPDEENGKVADAAIEELIKNK